VLLLNTDSTKHNFRLNFRVSVFSSNTSAFYFGEIDENLAVQNSVLIQVKELGFARDSGLLLFFLLAGLLFLL